MKKIAILGADKNLYGFYNQAKQLGYYIVGVAWPEGAVCKDLCDVFYPVSFSNKEQVVDICRKEQVDGITSFTLESALPTLIYVAQQLGLNANTEECMQRVATKYTQREAFQAAELPTPLHLLATEQNQAQIQINHYPIIIKPVDSGGSKGVFKVNNPADLQAALTQAIQCSKSHTAIVEEYIDGREFSVEYLSHNGKHYFCQLTDKVTSGEPNFIELQHHQPADVSEELRQRICATTEAALTALKIENSPSHTEIKLNSNNELYIIEIGARMGGDKITERLVKLSTGIDFVAETLKLATGEFTPPQRQYNKYSGVYFYSKLAPEVGTLIKNAKSYPELVEVQLTNDILEDVHSSAERNGYAIYQSDHKFVY